MTTGDEVDGPDPADGHRVRRYRDRYRRSGIPLGPDDLALISEAWDIVAHEPETYSARINTWYHERLMMTQAAGGAVTFTRSEGHLRDAYGRYVQMGLMHAGFVRSRQRGRTVESGPGGVVTLLLSEPFESRTEGWTDITLLYVPVEYLESRGINTRRLSCVTWEGGPLVGAFRELVVRTLAMDDAESLRQAPFVERALLELITGLVSAYDEGFDLEDEPADSARRRVVDLVEERYADPALGAGWIANRLGVSRRYLYRLFEGRDASIASMIRNRRIDHAEVLLRRPGKDLTLVRLARLCGFGGADQLTRAFKARNGQTPTEYRARRAAIGAD